MKDYQDLPKELEIIITKELIERSGEFTDNERCPISTFITEELGNLLLEDSLPNTALSTIHIKCLDGAHAYRFTGGFLMHDVELIMKTEIPLKITAYLMY